MFDSMYLPVLLAEEQSGFVTGLMKFLYVLAVIALVFVMPFLLGKLIARGVRLREYGFKLGLILASLTLALFVLYRAWNWDEKKFNIPLGVDLKGGVILIYEIESAGGGVARKGDGDQDDLEGIDINLLVTTLAQRINPSGTKEIVIRPYGERQVEIIIPEVETAEVEEIKRQIQTAGQLWFRIVANRTDHSRIIAAAEVKAQGPDPFSKNVWEGDELIGFWSRVAKEKLSAAEVRSTILRDSKSGRLVTLDEIGDEYLSDPEMLLTDFLDANVDDTGIEDLDALIAMNDGCNVTGDHLGVVSPSYDEYLNPCVNFRMKAAGTPLFRALTQANRPDMERQPPFYRQLGIVLDERLISFPRLITTISESGRITGNFTKEEVEFLVNILRSGKLPATLRKEPISENKIGSMLGDDTIRKGKVSIVVSLAAVLIFVAIYYRFSGLIACTALLVNLILIMALMVLLNAPLTLPGLAGLVLTIGMSVDANVLIFERIREELTRGAALRMAIRNGFARATTTIVDANVTTLITAMVLYAIGTDQIRGFAVTLILGIVMSMYTAIFCSRVVFDIAERRKWITELKMMRILGATKLDFLGKRQIAVAMSAILIVIGLIAVGVRGREIFDIDFNGGQSVTIVLKTSRQPDDIRNTLNEHFRDSDPPVTCSVNTVSVDDREPNTVYKIDADIQGQDISVLENAVKEAFRAESGESELLAYRMDYGDLKEEAVQVRPGAKPKVSTPAKAEADDLVPPTSSDDTVTPEVPAKSETADGVKTTPKPEAEPALNENEKAEPKKKDGKAEPEKKDTGEKTSQRSDLPSDNLLAWSGPSWVAAQDESAKTEEDAAKKGDESKENGAQPQTDPKDGAAEGDPKTPLTDDTGDEPANADSKTPIPSDVQTIAKLSFGEKINAPTLRSIVSDAYNKLYGVDPSAKNENEGEADQRRMLDVPGLIVCPDDSFNWDQGSAAADQEWYVRMVVPLDRAEQILSEVKGDLSNTPVFPSSSKIGGKVAGDTRNLAIAALIASLFGIVGYIWIRFQRVVFGVAAVIALVHDVLITLGAIAISAYLAKPLGFLLIDEFRISLPIVAAFLTIIGYSLNDTIVVFDRIREVRGKSPDLTAEMINTSINQTLSRTLLTSMTTLIVVAILYAIGGQGIHGFAFALVVGVLVGTYSSVFIASPALLWMFNLNKEAN